MLGDHALEKIPILPHLTRIYSLLYSLMAMATILDVKTIFNYSFMIPQASKMTYDVEKVVKFDLILSYVFELPHP